MHRQGSQAQKPAALVEEAQHQLGQAAAAGRGVRQRLQHRPHHPGLCLLSYSFNLELSLELCHLKELEFTY